LFRSKKCFRTTQKLEYLLFFVAHSAIFFPEFNIRLYDKNSESDYFFFLHQNQNIFFSNTGNQNIFLEKNHNPPPPFQGKWSFPKDTSLPGCHVDFKTIGGAFYPFYAAFRIVVQALNNSPRFVLNCCMVHTPEQM
jgi:hypothetical protein